MVQLTGAALERLAWSGCEVPRAGFCARRDLLLTPSAGVLPPEHESCCATALQAPCVRLQPRACGSCGRVACVFARQLCDHRGIAACSACWLARGDGDNADDRDVMALLGQVEDGEEFRDKLLILRTAPFAPHSGAVTRSLSTTSAPSPLMGLTPLRVNPFPGRCLPLETSAELTVVWDALSANSAVKARALRQEFVGLCRFVELHDPDMEALLERDPQLLRSRECICREGGLSAVLASGIFITRCEKYPKALLFELLYRKTVRLPSVTDAAHLKAFVFEPLRLIRLRTAAEGAPRWWLDPEALELIGDSLGSRFFAVVDGFLSFGEVATLQQAAQEFFVKCKMKPGIEEQSGDFGGYWGKGNEGDFQNREGAARKWTMEGDQRTWVGDNDAQSLALRPLASAIDALLAGIIASAARVIDGGGCAEAARRLQRVHFRENAMVSCYPGHSRGRYLRHCDTGRRAALTAILYLNEGWQSEDGGELRLYEEGFHNTQVKLDVLPEINRLLLFWATEECPHEVLPTRRDRFAVTTWYRDSAGLHATSLAEMVKSCNPVAPLTLEQASELAARTAMNPQ
eukprot:TRINITY_DN40328_c0_g1_i1.p1 TRINITY_DN40328_c0_g1~~TRINITY_DN40328_c0_g1_i1.p1  ORF type:complete len:574 (-),score=68.77 TRINITY_DN40328_c0_g1_i1:70-1791(-)